jgi:valyl-tRNA synthetase
MPTDAARAAMYWFNERLKQAIEEIEEDYRQYRISEALMTVYKLFWDEFASWYLEIIKPAPGETIDNCTLKTTIDIFEILLKMLHPFMPFITEEIWHQLKERPANCSIMNERNPAVKAFDKEKIKEFEVAREIVAFVRNTRSDKQISPREKLVLCIKRIAYDDDFDAAILKLANLSEIRFVEEKVEGAASLINRYGEFYIPLGDLHDHGEELLKLEKELVYTKGFLESVMKKLSNEKFVNNAPSNVLEMEQKKKTDAETKIKSIEEHLAHLKKQ